MIKYKVHFVGKNKFWQNSQVFFFSETSQGAVVVQEIEEVLEGIPFLQKKILIESVEKITHLDSNILESNNPATNALELPSFTIFFDINTKMVDGGVNIINVIEKK